MKRLLLITTIFIFIIVLAHQVTAGELTLLGQFNPSNASGLCGIGYDQTTDNVWVFGCFANDLQSYSNSGTYINSITRPGESANDVDIEFAPETILFGASSTSLPIGTLLFINGETSVAEIYALNKETGEIIETVITDFGAK